MFLLLMLLVLGCLAGYWFARRNRALAEHDWVARYRRLRGLVIAYGIFLGLVVVFSRKHGSSSGKELFPVFCWGLAFIMVLLQFFQTRKQMRAQAGFIDRAGKSLPRFFWQAAFILVPVIGLSAFGLYSLQQDRLLAEDQARESGRNLARELAQWISKEAAQVLRDYRNVSFELAANRSADLGLSQWAGGAPTESNAWRHIKAWQQQNPEIDLLKLLPAETSSYVETKAETMPPQPADWLGQLTPEQQQLWAAVKQAEFSGGDNSAAPAAIQKFIASKPPPGARANAEYLLLLAKTRGLAAGEAVTQIAEFSRSHWGNSDQTTDAGLPLGQLICYQALHRLPDGGGLPLNFIHNQTIAWMIQYRSSVFSPTLIAEVQRVTRGTTLEPYAATLKDWWNANAATRTVFQDFRDQFPTNTWKAAPFWVNSRLGSYLLILGDRWVAPTNWVVSSEPRYAYLLFPQAVVEKALARSVTQSELLLPSYARVEFVFGGKALTLSPRQAGDATNRPLPLLGEAAAILNDLPLNTNVYSFGVRVSLASPERLYARQAQRTRWFGALIVASAVAAVLGLFAAWRSFRHEQQLNELKTNFVSSVSHELRAPLASVRLMAENLECGKIPDPARQAEYFHFIGQECRRLSSLIENVLDFSRIEQGRKQYELEPTDLMVLTQTTVQLMEPYAAETGVALQLKTAHLAPRTAHLEWKVDGRAIQQALVNLLDNAIKHSARGQTVTVEIGSADPSLCTLSVSDCGPGIPKGEQEKIFERFYRLGSELRRETQGIGIGLSIVKHIVIAHGGRVTVASEPRQGSRFTLILPAAK